MEEKEQLSRIIELASELRKVLVQESFFNHHPELRGVVENLASSVENLAGLQQNKDENAQGKQDKKPKNVNVADLNDVLNKSRNYKTRINYEQKSRIFLNDAEVDIVVKK